MIYNLDGVNLKDKYIFYVCISFPAFGIWSLQNAEI